MRAFAEIWRGADRIVYSTTPAATTDRFDGGVVHPY
jgi:hypothetical protein